MLLEEAKLREDQSPETKEAILHEAEQIIEEAEVAKEELKHEQLEVLENEQAETTSETEETPTLDEEPAKVAENNLIPTGKPIPVRKEPSMKIDGFG